MFQLNPLKTPEVPYDFAVGRSNPETFPIELVQQAAIRAIGNEYEEISDYPGNLGHEGLREILARRESDREGVDVNPDLLALTNGSMQAVTLVAQALTRPGDTIICEEFTYVGTISAYQTLGIDMVGLPVDENGMKVDQLEQKLDELGEERKPKFIYVLATYHNPTGTQLSLDRRKDLIDIASSRNIPLFEDNCYGDVHYDGDKPPALYALADYENHIYCCSLSKILAPGLRLGYIMAQNPLFEQILSFRLDAGPNYLTSAIVAELYKDGLWDLTNALNEPLRDKRNLVIGGLERELGDLCLWSNPAGGMFVWIRIPDDVDHDRLEQKCADRGFKYQSGKNFHIDNCEVPYVRLAFAHLPDRTIKDGIPVFAQCLRESRTSNIKPDHVSLYA